jgi:hypothetical protein
LYCLLRQVLQRLYTLLLLDILLLQRLQQLYTLLLLDILLLQRLQQLLLRVLLLLQIRLGAGRRRWYGILLLRVSWD